MVSNIQVTISFLLLCFSSVGYSQSILSGSVNDYDGNALAAAEVMVLETGKSVYTDELGLYVIQNINPGNYTLSASYLGLSTQNKEVTIIRGKEEIIDFTLSQDPLHLTQVVIVDRGQDASSLQLSQNIASISGSQVAALSSYGTADLLGNLPGVFADASAGEVFTRVYSRGISISAEDDLGWYYVGLEEDGLPITATQHVYYSPDLFHRADLTLHSLEGITGGKSAILGVNSPGGLFNFITKTGGQASRGELLLTTGLEGGINPMTRVDLGLSGPINKDWTYFFGGFYRRATGAREVDFDWQKGGQIKANITRQSAGTQIKVYGKYLNDHTNRWTGLPATNWEKPEAAFGTDFSSHALMLPSLTSRLPDGRNTGQTLDFDSNSGIHTTDLAIGLDFKKIMPNWVIRNNFKFSDKQADWQSSIGNQPLGLESFFPYLLSGISPDFSTLPLGNVVFKDAVTKDILARIDNLGILSEPASFSYLEGSLPNNTLMGTAPWRKIDQNQEFMNRFSLHIYFDRHTLSSSLFFARSAVETYTTGSFAYVTYEPHPKLLEVTLENPGEGIIRLSDGGGMANYNGLFYNQGEAVVTQWHGYLNDKWEVSDQWTMDAGLQFSRISQSGSKENPAPLGDLDNNPQTAFNNSVLGPTSTDNFDHTYDNFNWSIGLLYQFGESTSLYGRFTDGRKSPELNYAFSNFTGIPISRPGRSQKIRQLELGIKTRSRTYAIDAQLFMSNLDNVAFSEFVFDEEEGTLFFTPEQLNSTSTVGLNLKGFYAVSRFISLVGNLTIQNPKANQFTVYNTAGTIDDTDDGISDFSDNQLPHNPQLAFKLKPEISLAKNKFFLQYNYIGSRYGNIENSFMLPGFGKIDGGMDFAYNDHLIFSLMVNNILNGEGLMNFYGPNEFGSSANQATQSYIDNNPDSSFIVFPILPRTFYLKIIYDF